jgi:2,3-bisphosphoglycerate-independent phosphoglycerate mutase
MKRPVVLIVMDGVALSDHPDGNAVLNAHTPTLDRLMKEMPFTTLKAHGEAVGLPSDEDMGNSEVGHNAIGCGQIYAQGAKLVNQSIASGALFSSDTWKTVVQNAAPNTLHFIGLLSDGNVHAHIDHLLAMIRQAKQDGVQRVRSHILLDGRDVPSTSALTYVEQLEALFDELNDERFDGRIASGGGRMLVTMDRYEAEWSMVETGWKTHVLGEGRSFASAKEAIETYRAELNCNDQYLPAFVIAHEGKPVGTIEDHDVVIFNNFRGDRAIEISKAFENEDFPYFDRKRRPQVFYAGMLQYDGDLKIPYNFLVTPPRIQNTLTEWLLKSKVASYAISETQKFGHMTYFFNGNRSEKFDDALETWVEIKSDLLPFEQRPWMKAAEITDHVIEAIQANKYTFIRANFPNGDMVGHTGNYLATLISVETVDLQLARLVEACRVNDAILIVTADHGNADEMFEKRKDPNQAPKPKTSHSLNPVPFLVVGQAVRLKQGAYGLSNIAATITDLLGLAPNPVWQESLIEAQ